MLQDLASSKVGQGVPSFSASWTTPLPLNWVPLPQVTLQSDHEDQSSTSQSTEQVRNYFIRIKYNLGIDQCCKALLPPKLDRQLLLSLPLEQLLFLSSWFLLRRSRCSQTTRTNLQLCSQLVEQILKADEIVMVAEIMMMIMMIIMRVCLYFSIHPSNNLMACKRVCILRPHKMTVDLIIYSNESNDN